MYLNPYQTVQDKKHIDHQNELLRRSKYRHFKNQIYGIKTHYENIRENIKGIYRTPIETIQSIKMLDNVLHNKKVNESNLNLQFEKQDLHYEMLMLEEARTQGTFNEVKVARSQSIPLTIKESKLGTVNTFPPYYNGYMSLINKLNRGKHLRISASTSG
jgi:hypothetical protein